MVWENKRENKKAADETSSAANYFIYSFQERLDDRQFFFRKVFVPKIFLKILLIL